ncbi:hypothetical protein HF086_012320 [Spodoptera exigua]|uniref:Uncharacterized protein n=1 Tax=Spodoptera exigua TaxID=7107 RepID=A0A922SMG8_SPOEX|nr:hypothetical protein HF086_012320 [Spodoptera exigua]
MNSDLFVEAMKHFVKFTVSSKDNPSLLLMDNHEKIFSELEFLPSNVTDRPQPILDETTPTNIDDDDATSCDSSLADKIKQNWMPITTWMSASRITPDSSQPYTNFVSPKDFRPIIKGPQNTRKSRKKAGKSMIATDTPEKKCYDGKKNKETKKSKKEAEKMLGRITYSKATTTFTTFFKRKRFSFPLNKLCKRRKRNLTPLESLDNDQEEFQPSGSSSGGENLIASDSDEDDLVLRDDFPPLKHSLRENDFIIIIKKIK